MAAYVKFNTFVQDICNGKHNLSSDTLNILLTNTSPNAADTVVDTTTTPCTIRATSSAVELAAVSGYVKGGNALTLTTNSQTGGTYTLAANQSVWTAGALTASFRYVALYNATNGSTSTRPVIAWWDYGSSIALNPTETFTVQFNSSNPGTIFTLT